MIYLQIWGGGEYDILLQPAKYRILAEGRQGIAGLQICFLPRTTGV